MSIGSLVGSTSIATVLSVSSCSGILAVLGSGEISGVSGFLLGSSLGSGGLLACPVLPESFLGPCLLRMPFFGLVDLSEGTRVWAWDFVVVG